MLPQKIEGSVAVFGDLHGQADALDRILKKLSALPDFESRAIVFLGDLVDRGDNSQSVLERIANLQQQHQAAVTGCCGNHDLAMAASLKLVPTPNDSGWENRWVNYYDSQTTFASYGVPFGDLTALKKAMPESHQQILASLPWCVEHADYLFVHAGLDPHTPYEVQLEILRQKDFTLHRPQWLCEKKLVFSDVPVDCPVSVVSGHATVPQVMMSRKRILCDTTGGHSGDLSCVLLPEKIVVTSGEGANSTQQLSLTPSTTAIGKTTSNEKAWWKLW